MSFGQRLISLRREHQLTQQGLSDATGIHVQQIKRYEAGTSQPSAEALKKIARAFSVTTDWLLFEDTERSPADDLRLQFEAVSQFSPEEKAVARTVIESLILRHTATRFATPSTPAAAAKQEKAKA